MFDEGKKGRAVTGARISHIGARAILDSHLEWTPEFEVQLADGREGRGSAPRGETLSVFETLGATSIGDMAAEAADALVGSTFDQVSFDAVLEDWIPSWGPQATLALSIAHYLASGTAGPGTTDRAPRLLLNVLNGGLHAYTNPIESDFHEIMLYAASPDLGTTADAYRRLLDRIRQGLREYPSIEVGGNAVHRLGSPANEAALTFLGRLLHDDGLEDTFAIAVDASAGDWWNGEEYVLPVTGRRMSSDEVVEWSIELATNHGVALLEDPLAERDRAAWARLKRERPATCSLLGDNYTSTSAERLADRSADIDGVLVKPNQNGTVSGSLDFAKAARAAGLSVIASHRSVETESTFLVELARDMGADGMKIGPFRDFTAVVKFNELLRRYG